MKILNSTMLGSCTLLSLCLLASSATAMPRPDENVVTANDADGDRVVDTVDVDDDNDGIPDVLEISSNGLDIDSDGDGVPDRLDLDSDNDGVLDWQESGVVIGIDFSSMRVVNGRILGRVGLNGFNDDLETGLDNGQMRYSLVNTDYPEDNLPDVLDLDSDNDGLTDLIEAGVDPSLDSDNDARIDFDISTGSVGRDGIPDRLQNTNDETCCDVNDDGVEDIVPRNTDGTDFPDFQDHDSDNDGVFDIVEAGGSDFNNDGFVDNFFDSPVLDGMDDAILMVPFVATDANGNGVFDHVDEFAQASAVGEVEAPINVPEPVPAAAQPDPEPEPVEMVDRNPVPRPGSDIPPGVSADDPTSGLINTGLNASGCSVQSSGIDLILLLLSVLSITVLGWRYTLRRIKI